MFVSSPYLGRDTPIVVGLLIGSWLMSSVTGRMLTAISFTLIIIIIIIIIIMFTKLHYFHLIFISLSLTLLYSCPINFILLVSMNK